MPVLADMLAKRAGITLNAIHDSVESFGKEILDYPSSLDKRVYIPCCNESSPPGLVQAETVDPWQKSGKYALAWVYFCLILLVLTSAIRWYHFWNDKIRTAIYKEENQQANTTLSPATDYVTSAAPSSHMSTQPFFPPEGPLPGQHQQISTSSTSRPINAIIAIFRYIFYHPVPNIRLRRGWRPVIFPPLGTLVLFVAALTLVLGYNLIPQPLFWESIRYGSPPIAIRAGMLAIAMVPWIIGLSMKANLISILTGIGHERLNVLHRWLAYIFLILSLIHTIPFYITPIWEDGGRAVFQAFFTKQHFYVYGTGIAALVPLIILCLHSLPPLRRKFYELFLMAHVPVSVVLIAMLFWHCNNYLSSWNYLFATLGIWISSYVLRLIFYLNWTNPWRISWLIGEEAGVSLLPANAVKVTIPTQMKWKPGQYVYLRMPGVSVFESHPFTIASLCSDDFPSEYGEQYRDMVLVFRPFSGFTQRIVGKALDNGPWHTYQAFLDGPYGGVRRSMDSFDHVVMIAGGSGITAIISHLLDLIKRMRDGKAVTKSVELIWALKRPETMEWFNEELRICRDYAPPDSVRCHFYITAAKRQNLTGDLVSATTPNRPVSMVFHNKLNDVFQNIANNRFSTSTSQRNSAFIRDEAQGDAAIEKELRDENVDRLRPLPEARLKRGGALSPSRLAVKSGLPDSIPTKETPDLPPHPSLHEKRRTKNLSLDLNAAREIHTTQMQQLTALPNPHEFDFGFPSTPSEFQKGLMRFAFMPAAAKSQRSGWSVEWGRPDLPYILKDMSSEWSGRRACVFVCGPPSLRVDVSNCVAKLQKSALRGDMDEIYLHAENYAL